MTLSLWALFFLGVLVGLRLSARPHVVSYKILNVLGCAYGLLGVLVLSEFVIERPQWRKFIVRGFSGAFAWAHIMVPVGAGVGCAYGMMNHHERFPSAQPMAEFFIGFNAVAYLSTWVLEDLVIRPSSKKFVDPLLRTRIFGLFLVIAGLIVQLIAAILDFLQD